MPYTSLPHATLTSPADDQEIIDNFDALLVAINGGLDNDNISSGAGIATSKLAANDYEFLVPLHIQPTTAVQPPTSAARPISSVALPGSTTDGAAYTVLSGAWLTTNAGTGAGNTTFNIQLGYMSAGAWVLVSQVVAATSIVANADLQSGELTINVAALTLHATIQYHLGLFLTAIAGDALNTAHDVLSATLKLSRTDGLR